MSRPSRPGPEDDLARQGSALLEQHKVVRSQIEASLVRMERGLALGVAALAAVAGLGGFSGDDLALLLLPVALIGAYTYGCQQLLEIVLLGGYARLLEERLNAVFGEPVWLWEVVLVPRLAQSPMSYALGAVAILMVAGGSALTAHALWHQIPPCALVLGCVVIAAYLVATQIKIREGAQNAYGEARRFYDDAKVEY